MKMKKIKIKMELGSQIWQHKQIKVTVAAELEEKQSQTLSQSTTASVNYQFLLKK
tara:strand:- start:1287 stop:1451 length:165 start_codon:yes stop_codon:yes gene_type:complete